MTDIAGRIDDELFITCSRYGTEDAIGINFLLYRRDFTYWHWRRGEWHQYGEGESFPEPSIKMGRGPGNLLMKALRRGPYNIDESFEFGTTPR